jgi:hypothetical protein
VVFFKKIRIVIKNKSGPERQKAKNLILKLDLPTPGQLHWMDFRFRLPVATAFMFAGQKSKT